MADHEDHASSSSCDYSKKRREGSSYAYNSNWMSHWIKATSMQASLANKHTSSVYVQEKVSGCTERGRHIWPSMPKEREGNTIKDRTGGLINGSMVVFEPRAAVDRCSSVKYIGSGILPPSLERKERAATVSFDDNVMPSTSQMKGPVFSYEDAPNPSPAFQSHLRSNNVTHFSQGQSSRQKCSSLLFHQKETEHHLSPVPISSRCNLQPLIIKEQQPNMQKFSTPLEPIPCPVSNVQTMKISTTFDAMEDSSGRAPNFSKTTHHFLLLQKKTDVNFSGGHEQLRESTVPTRLAFSKYLCLPPTLGSYRLPGVKIQPLQSSSGNKEHLSYFDAKCESSAEKNTEVMDPLQDRCTTLGMASSPLIKMSSVAPPPIFRNLQPSAVITCSDSSPRSIVNTPTGQVPRRKFVDEGNFRKDSVGDLDLPIIGVDSAKEKSGCKIHITEIPDINEEPLGLDAESSFMHMEATSSRTQRLDVKHLLSHAEESYKSAASSPNQDRDLGIEPSGRGVKRLRLSPFNSLGNSTKSPNIGETSSNEKVMFLKRIMMHKHYGQRQMTLNQSVEPLKNGGRPSNGDVDKSRSAMLSHSWTRRWCHSFPETEEKNSKAEVTYEPERTKVTRDDLEKKQFPSIAAMALMGKAIKGFHPCKYRKRGPVMVWTTNEY